MNWVCTHLRDRNYKLPRDDVHNILLLEPWGIGDLVIASYCLPPLRKCFNNATITVLCSPVAAELMAGCPYVDEVVSYKFQWTNNKNKYSLLRYDWRSLVSFISDMKRMEFDIALTGRPDPRYNWLFWLFGWPVSELSTPKWRKVEASFSCSFFPLDLTHWFTIYI